MNVLWYLIGLKKGKQIGEKEGEKSVSIDSTYTFTDANTNGNIVVTKENT